MMNKNTLYRLRLFWHLDKLVMIVIVILLCVSIVLVNSASIEQNAFYRGDSLYNLKKHFGFIIIGLIGLIISFSLGIEFWQKHSWLLYLLGLILLLIVFFVGLEINGSRRWLSLGIFNLQPTEFIKIFMILIIAKIIQKQNWLKDYNFKTLFIILLCFLAYAGLLLIQPDFGSFLVILMTILILLFLVGLPWKYTFVLVLTFIVCIIPLIIFFPYRLQRFISFLNPWEDMYGSGYQLSQALIAVGSGGLFGQGIGQSKQKLFFLPESHTDFIFAVLTEEIGLIGALVVLFFYLLLFIRFLWMLSKIFKLYGLSLKFKNLVLVKWHSNNNNKLNAKRVKYYKIWLEKVEFLIIASTGLIVLLIIEILLNLGVNLGILPTKGLPLPFLSYGGSSMVSSLIIVGIILRFFYESQKLTESLQKRM